MLSGLGVVLLILLLAAGSLYGYARYRFGELPTVKVPALLPVGSGQPFNMLVIGSDSRLDLTPAEQAAAGTEAQVAGQRSDVVMIWHIVPSTHAVTIMSIPRDTLVQMDGDRSQFGEFNRINASFDNGPNLLVKTIEDNFGIPINHVAEVDFGGFEGAVNALGGVYLDFPYPAKDAYSGLDITHAGCQLLDGAQALAVARSRHYTYLEDGVWQYDPTSDFGRIDRQDAFLRALMDRAKSEFNPLTLNAFIGSLHEGITLDSSFSLGGFISFGEDLRSVSGGTLTTYTMPTYSEGSVSPWGDVLFVEQPAAEEMLASIFSGELAAPATPPPNGDLVPTPPPDVTTSTSGGAIPAVLTAAATAPTFDPRPCSP